MGTVEQRGMDGNHPRLLLAVGASLNSVLNRVFMGHLKTRISDEAISKPFTIEGDSILVPPHSHLVSLSLNGALKGLEDPQVKAYCQAYYKLVSGMQKEDYTHFLSAPIENILTSGQTVSYERIAFAKKMGYKNGDNLDAAIAREISLDHALRFRREVGELNELMSYLI